MALHADIFTPEGIYLEQVKENSGEFNPQPNLPNRFRSTGKSFSADFHGDGRS